MWGVSALLFCQSTIQFLYYNHDNDPQEGKRLASRPTLFYLMHCGKALYNNLLWKNWSTQCLPRLSVIGNSFSSMRERFVRPQSEVVLVLLVKSEVSSECLSLHQGDRAGVQSGLQLHHSGRVCVRRGRAVLPVTMDRRLQ